MPHRQVAALALCLPLLAACQNPNQAALALGAPPANIAELRAAQIQRFSFPSEAVAVQAAAETLQSMGFMIELGSYEAGAIVGSTNSSLGPGEIAGRSLALALFGGVGAPPFTVQRTTLATVTVLELPGTRTQLVRIATETLARDNRGRVAHTGHPPRQIHADFFARLQSRVVTLPPGPRS